MGALVNQPEPVNRKMYTASSGAVIEDHQQHCQSPELMQQTDPVGFTHRPAPERSG